MNGMEDNFMANIRKRGDSYQIRVSVGYDALGRQIVRSMTWKPKLGMSEKQIEKELNRQAVLFEEERTDGYSGGSVKFEKFAEEWMCEYAQKNLRNTTYNTLCRIRPRVYDALGHISMDKLTVRQIQKFVNSLSEEGANKVNGKPLAPVTVRHMLAFVSDVFSYGIRMGIVRDNPCSKVILPKLNPPKKRIYTREEVCRLMQCLENGNLQYRALFTLLIFTGCRREEIMGLEWKDIDLENGIIDICRTSCYTPRNGIYTDTTKTERSKRLIRIPKDVADILKEHRADQLQRAELLGDKWADCDRLFTNQYGKPLHPGVPYCWLSKFCKKNDIPFYGLHTFRHLFASLLVNNGVDIVTVSGVLGHSAVSTTSNIYCHMLDEARIRAADTVSAALGLGTAIMDK